MVLQAGNRARFFQRLGGIRSIKLQVCILSISVRKLCLLGVDASRLLISCCVRERIRLIRNNFCKFQASFGEGEVACMQIEATAAHGDPLWVEY